LAAVSIVLSGYLLFIAQKSIPMGTAYAVWTGIGAAGAFVVGVILFIFKDALSLMRITSVLLIILGVIGLKLSSH
jgi:quaternary ammonium compound-resistance protein SugE